MKMFFAPALALALTAIAPWPNGAEAANLLKNPGFETGDFTGWFGDRNSVITTTPEFIPETIRTGSYGARIFPGSRAMAPVFLFQPFTIPEAADQLRFGGNLRFFSFNTFWGNPDQGLIWFYTVPGPSVVLGAQANGLSSSLAGNGARASDWLYFENVVDVAGLGGQTAFFSLVFLDAGVPQDTAIAFDDLFVEVVPVPTPALLPGVVGLGLALWRKKVGDRKV
jgi:hypothetical protein